MSPVQLFPEPAYLLQNILGLATLLSLFTMPGLQVPFSIREQRSFRHVTKDSLTLRARPCVERDRDLLLYRQNFGLRRTGVGGGGQEGCSPTALLVLLRLELPPRRWLRSRDCFLISQTSS